MERMVVKVNRNRDLAIHLKVNLYNIGTKIVEWSIGFLFLYFNSIALMYIYILPLLNCLTLTIDFIFLPSKEDGNASV